MIRRIKQLIETQTSILQKKAGIFKEENVECVIDEDVVECKEIDIPPYTGIPAPALNPEDDWFASPYTLTEPELNNNQEEYQQEAVERLHDDIRKHDNKEPEDIHQVMYDMATRNGSTTIQLNPVGGSENFQGGSENFHER
tara:strand:- start:300 stop:722 length:423 start_codon:yes stop_codon:yes gene_type:complete